MLSEVLIMANELTSEHAKALSDLGASKGGKARAESLSPEARSSIARRAAEARWATVDKFALPKETHPGIIKIGQTVLQCGVLDNEIRVFSTRGITRAMGGKKTGTVGTSNNGAPQLPSFLASDAVKSFVSQQLMARLLTPLQYRPKHGGRTAFGYEATILPEICEAILDANDNGALKPNQKHLAEKANTLIRAFAKVGIIALVDEATGYQYDRAKDDLTRLLEMYVQEPFRPYVSKFKHEFFREIYRIYGWEYKSGNTQSPRYVGKFINKYIYEPLLPNILPRLQTVNPTNNKGQRARKHFQHLSDGLGDPHVDKQIAVVTSLLRLSDNPQEFDSLYQRACGKGYQPSFNFADPQPLIIDVDAEM
jgi:hypothetical protein